MSILSAALLSSSGGFPGRKPSSWGLATPQWSASRSPAQVVVVDDRPHYRPNKILMKIKREVEAMLAAE
jgi:hypothetical protein